MQLTELKPKTWKKEKKKKKGFPVIYKLNVLDDILLVSIDINQFTTTNLRQNLIYYTSRLIVLNVIQKNTFMYWHDSFLQGTLRLAL